MDCFVVTKTPLRTGQIVDCDPVGLMEQIEDGEVDHKVLAVVRGEKETLDANTRRILIEFARHVFDHVPGKAMRVGEFRDRVAALEHVQQHQDPTTMT